MSRILISSKQPQWFQRSQTLQLSFFGKKKPSKKEDRESVQELYKVVTMDDMPKPFGDWTEHNAKRNRKYNTVLAFGFISLIGSIFVLKESVFFNAFPPPYPFDEKDEKKKCDCN